MWGALGAFHLWLLAGQAWTGQVEYEGLLRWIVALGLVAAFIAVRNSGRSLFGGRRATAIWVLVALLHGPVLAEGVGLATQVLAETPIVAVQLVCAATGVGLALAAAARRDAQQATECPAPLVAAWLRPITAMDAHLGPGFLPRPPPVA